MLQLTLLKDYEGSYRALFFNSEMVEFIYPDRSDITGEGLGSVAYSLLACVEEYTPLGASLRELTYPGRILTSECAYQVMADSDGLTEETKNILKKGS